MDKTEALNHIKTALQNTIEREENITEKSHLVNEEIIDSLDSAVFMLELEKLCNKKLPQKDVNDNDLYQVGNLINYLTSH